MTDDTAIVEGLRQNEPDAARRLVDAHGRRLLRSAVLLCGNEPDAQDAVQETLITAVKVIARFRGSSALYTWLHGILINVVRHIVRGRKPTIALDEAPEQADSRTPDIRRSQLSAL
jgi:RNA polymerase sigma-70 factor (ECF subfamily)